MRRVSLAAERDVGEVEAEERNGGRGGVAESGAILAVVPCVVCEFTDRVQLEFLFLGDALWGGMKRVSGGCEKGEKGRERERTAQV